MVPLRGRDLCLKQSCQPAAQPLALKLDLCSDLGNSHLVFTSGLTVQGFFRACAVRPSSAPWQQWDHHLLLTWNERGSLFSSERAGTPHYMHSHKLQSHRPIIKELKCLISKQQIKGERDKTRATRDKPGGSTSVLEGWCPSKVPPSISLSKRYMQEKSGSRIVAPPLEVFKNCIGVTLSDTV